MTPITFNPWIGKDYEEYSFEGLKTLILGESHYGDTGNETFHYTEDVVKQHAIIKSIAFFTKIAKSMHRLPASRFLTPVEKEKFWHSVAFYNFIQQFVGEEPRKRPSLEQWRLSSQAFTEVIFRLKPNICVVFGQELWDHLPPSNTVYSEDGFKTLGFDVGASRQMLTGHVKHPSSRYFKYTDVNPRIEALIKLSKS